VSTPIPGIPGDDMPLTPDEVKQLDELAKKPAAEQQRRYTPPPIEGYRTLTQVEVNMMNLIKGHGTALESLVLSVQGHLLMQRREAARLAPIQASDAELRRLDRAEADRWARIAATHFQEGLMALARAVAQPTTF
jgi:hypothetical protein